MANQYKNEVIYSGQTLISLKEDTVTPNTVLTGETFHDRSGTPQTGNLITHTVYDGLDSTSASDALSANQGRVLNSKFSGNKSAQVKNISTVYFTERSGFTAVRNGRILGFSGYFNVTTQIPESTAFATYGILSNKAQFVAVNIGNHSAYIINTTGNGRLAANENIPTGYYYIVGSAWIDG